MKCEEFLARHSEYVDGRMLLPDVARCREHIKECATCARYHRVVERGGDLVRDLPYVEPSSGFYLQLRRRLAQAEPARGAAPMDAAAAAEDRRAGPGALVALSIAAVVTLIAWSPLMRAPVLTVELPAMVARAPAAQPVWRVLRVPGYPPGQPVPPAELWPSPDPGAAGPAGVFPAFGERAGGALPSGLLDPAAYWPAPNAAVGMPRLRASSLD